MSNKPKKYAVKYAMAHGGGITVYLDFNPRKGVCHGCGKSVARGEIRGTQLHHWWYAYQPKTVKDNPVLALDNTSELCFYCHELADAIRALLYSNPERAAMVANCLTGKQREKFISVIDVILIKMKEVNTRLVDEILGKTKI